MKKFIYSCAIISLLGSDCLLNAKIVVNGEVISDKQIARQLKTLLPAATYHSTVNDQKKKELESEAIQQLINKTLLVQYAKQEDIVVTSADVKEAESKYVKAVGDVVKFNKLLSASSLTNEEFRAELHRDLLVKKLYETHVKITISDSELSDYYEKNKYKFKEPEKIKLSLIYVRNDPELKDGKQIARKRADEAMAKLKKGETFADVAAKYSNDLTRIKGGDMGYIHRGRIDNALVDKVAFSMKKSEMSGIIETDVGCYILKVEDKKEPNQLSYAAVKEKLRAELKDNREKEKMDTILAALKKQALIKKQ